ncbi:hypothetical protein AB7M16_000264 [Bradyrhizobium sp. USDA 372]
MSAVATNSCHWRDGLRQDAWTAVTAQENIGALDGFVFGKIDGVARRAEDGTELKARWAVQMKSEAKGVAAISHEILVSLLTFPNVSQ